MVGGALETGRKRLTKEQVVVSVDRHFISELAEMKERGQMLSSSSRRRASQIFSESEA